MRKFFDLFSVFTFYFFIWRWLFALIDVAVTTSNASTFRISKPWVFIGAVSAGFHISCVGDISCFECQGAFVATTAWLLSGGCWLATIPSFKCVQIFIFLWIGDPLEGLGCGDKPDIGSKINGVNY